jgi:hypothetical protein
MNNEQWWYRHFVAMFILGASPPSPHFFGYVPVLKYKHGDYTGKINFA